MDYYKGNVILDEPSTRRGPLPGMIQLDEPNQQAYIEDVHHYNAPSLFPDGMLQAPRTTLELEQCDPQPERYRIPSCLPHPEILFSEHANLPTGSDYELLERDQLVERMLTSATLAATTAAATPAKFSKSQRASLVAEQNYWLLQHALIKDRDAVFPSCGILDRDLRKAKEGWRVPIPYRIQHMLMTEPALRQLLVILTWLEDTYDCSSAVEGFSTFRGAAHNNEHGFSTHREENDIFIRKCMLRLLRGGRVAEAALVAQCGLHTLIDAVRILGTQLRGCSSSIVSSSAGEEDQQIRPQWIPLFGEYRTMINCEDHAQDAAEASMINSRCTCNDGWVAHLTKLYETSVKSNKRSDPDAMGYDEAICALLSGNNEDDTELRRFLALEAALNYSTSQNCNDAGNTHYLLRWQDEMWLTLRSALLCTFAHCAIHGDTLFNDLSRDGDSQYVAFVNSFVNKAINTAKVNGMDPITKIAIGTHSSESYVAAYVRLQLSRDIRERYIKAATNFAEELQLRLIYSSLDPKNNEWGLFGISDLHLRRLTLNGACTVPVGLPAIAQEQHRILQEGEGSSKNQQSNDSVPPTDDQRCTREYNYIAHLFDPCFKERYQLWANNEAFSRPPPSAVQLYACALLIHRRIEKANNLALPSRIRETLKSSSMDPIPQSSSSIFASASSFGDNSSSGLKEQQSQSPRFLIVKNALQYAVLTYVVELVRDLPITTNHYCIEYLEPCAKLIVEVVHDEKVAALGFARLILAWRRKLLLHLLDIENSHFNSFTESSGALGLVPLPKDIMETLTTHFNRDKKTNPADFFMKAAQYLERFHDADSNCPITIEDRLAVALLEVYAVARTSLVFARHHFGSLILDAMPDATKAMTAMCGNGRQLALPTTLTGHILGDRLLWELALCSNEGQPIKAADSCASLLLALWASRRDLGTIAAPLAVIARLLNVPPTVEACLRPTQDSWRLPIWKAIFDGSEGEVASASELQPTSLTFWFSVVLPIKCHRHMQQRNIDTARSLLAEALALPHNTEFNSSALMTALRHERQHRNALFAAVARITPLGGSFLLAISQAEAHIQSEVDANSNRLTARNSLRACIPDAFRCGLFVSEDEIDDIVDKYDHLDGLGYLARTLLIWALCELFDAATALLSTESITEAMLPSVIECMPLNFMQNIMNPVLDSLGIRLAYSISSSPNDTATCPFSTHDLEPLKESKTKYEDKAREVGARLNINN